nr:ATP-binding protein [uncultured Actinotalea sp.]
MSAQRAPATVHLLAGLNGAGKTTYARRLARTGPAVRFTLDEWMLRLYATPYDDPRYPELRDTCTDLVWDVARQVLDTGTDVVLDWNQWSRTRRAFWRDRALSAGHEPVLHHVRVPLVTAIARVEQRARDGVPGAHVVPAEDVRHLAGLFEEPSADEGLVIRTVDATTTDPR